MENYPTPRHKNHRGNFPYTFKLKEEFSYDTGWILEQEFKSEWLHISASGVITIPKGYAWDGCTPKWSIFNLFILGTPDGHIDYRTGEPFTYRASLIHDALYQYLDNVPVSKEDIDLLFLDMLGDFKPRKIYYFFVKYLGGRGVIQKGLKG